MNPFRQLLLAHGSKAPIGTWIMSASPIVAEAVGTAGFDWGVLDMEHAPLDLTTLVHLLQAVGNTKMVPVVRVPWNDAVTVKRVLDAGAQTLLFPFYLPPAFPECDLILSFAENKSVAELIPEIALMTKARGVVAAVDNEAWLPRGLARQLIGWLERMGVACATPKPLCSLTGHDYYVTRRERERYDSPVIREFARYFGQPDIQITVDEESRTIASAQVRRDAVCGCARHVAEKLIGLSANEAEERAGLFHHHFPCLASMVKLNDYNHDTLMHESGHLLLQEFERRRRHLHR